MECPSGHMCLELLGPDNHRQEGALVSLLYTMWV